MPRWVPQVFGSEVRMLQAGRHATEHASACKALLRIARIYTLMLQLILKIQ